MQSTMGGEECLGAGGGHAWQMPLRAPPPPGPAYAAPPLPFRTSCPHFHTPGSHTHGCRARQEKAWHGLICFSTAGHQWGVDQQSRSCVLCSSMQAPHAGAKAEQLKCFGRLPCEAVHSHEMLA